MMLLALVFPCDIRQLPTSVDAIQSPSRLYPAGRYSPPAPGNSEAEASQTIREREKIRQGSRMLLRIRIPGQRVGTWALMGTHAPRLNCLSQAASPSCHSGTNTA
jgi:hypothetical protein